MGFLQWIYHSYFFVDGLPITSLSLSFASNVQILCNLVSSRLVMTCSVLFWLSSIACDMWRAMSFVSIASIVRSSDAYSYHEHHYLWLLKKSILDMKYVPYFWHAKYLCILHEIHIILAFDVNKSRHFMPIEIHKYIQIWQTNNYINCKFVTSLFISLICKCAYDYTESFMRNSNIR
jgi:hypothetical protein